MLDSTGANVIWSLCLERHAPWLTKMRNLGKYQTHISAISLPGTSGNLRIISKTDPSRTWELHVADSAKIHTKMVRESEPGSDGALLTNARPHKLTVSTWFGVAHNISVKLLLETPMRILYLHVIFLPLFTLC